MHKTTRSVWPTLTAGFLQDAACTGYWTVRALGPARPGPQARLRLCLYVVVFYSFPRSPADNYQPTLRPEPASRTGPQPCPCGFVSVAHRDNQIGFVLPAVGG